MMIQLISLDGRYEITVELVLQFVFLTHSKFCASQVHIEGEGVGFILSCLGPFFSGVRFEVQVKYVMFLCHRSTKNDNLHIIFVLSFKMEEFSLFLFLKEESALILVKK